MWRGEGEEAALDAFGLFWGDCVSCQTEGVPVCCRLVVLLVVGELKMGVSFFIFRSSGWALAAPPALPLSGIRRDKRGDVSC